MILGIVENNRPLISLVVGWQLMTQEIVALVDTGFTGELKLSPKSANELGLRTTHTETILLADEKPIDMPAGLALVSMEGNQKVVDVLIGEGESIIGVGLLKKFQYNLNINFNLNNLTLEKF